MLECTPFAILSSLLGGSNVGMLERGSGMDLSVHREARALLLSVRNESS